MADSNCSQAIGQMGEKQEYHSCAYCLSMFVFT